MKKEKNLLEKEELLVYSCFDLHTKNIEELVQMTDLPAAKVADILMRLCSADGLMNLLKIITAKNETSMKDFLLWQSTCNRGINLQKLRRSRNF